MKGIIPHCILATELEHKKIDMTNSFGIRKNRDFLQIFKNNFKLSIIELS